MEPQPGEKSESPLVNLSYKKKGNQIGEHQKHLKTSNRGVPFDGIMGLEGGVGIRKSRLERRWKKGVELLGTEKNSERGRKKPRNARQKRGGQAEMF